MRKQRGIFEKLPGSVRLENFTRQQRGGEQEVRAVRPVVHSLYGERVSAGTEVERK